MLGFCSINHFNNSKLCNKLLMKEWQNSLECELYEIKQTDYHNDLRLSFIRSGIRRSLSSDDVMHHEQFIYFTWITWSRVWQILDACVTMIKYCINDNTYSSNATFWLTSRGWYGHYYDCTVIRGHVWRDEWIEVMHTVSVVKRCKAKLTRLAGIARGRKRGRRDRSDVSKDTFGYPDRTNPGEGFRS